MASGANCFLSSPHRIDIVGSNPTTERGVSTIINAHPKSNKIIYPSGKYIVVRNLDSPGDTFVYRGHSSPTTVAKFSPNGFWVASGDTSGKIRIWSWDNPEHLLKIEVPVFAGPVFDLDWDFEAKKIVASGEGGQFLVKCFTWDSGNSVGEMVGHTKRVLSCTYKPTRPFRIMTGSMDFGSIFYAGPPFKLDHSNNVHTNFVNCVRYSADGNKIVSVGSDKRIQLYDGTTGQPLADVTDGHSGSIYSISFSPDSTKFITASADKTLKVWDATTLTCLHTITITTTPEVGDMQNSVLWLPTCIVSLSLNGTLNIISVDDYKVISTIHGHQASISSVYVDSTNKLVYTGSNDGVVSVTNTQTSVLTKIGSQDKKSVNGGAHSGKVAGVAVTGDMLISVGWDDMIRYADLTSNKYYENTALKGQPISLATCHIANLYAIVTTEELSLYHEKNKTASLLKLPYTATCLALVSEQEVAVGGDDNKTHIYSIENGTFTEKHTILTRSPVSSLSYSPNQEYLAIGDNGRQIEVYVRHNWSTVIQGIWVYHSSKITALSWSPNSNYLASGSLDESIYIWSIHTPKNKIQYSYAHMGGVSGLGWIDDQKLVSTGNDQVIVTWKVHVE